MPPRPIGGGRGMPPRHFGPHYFHPKPRYYTQYGYYPYNYYPYYYNYPYYYYPSSYYLIDDTEEKCFCMDPQYKDLQVCVDGKCGACIRKSLCSECDDKISCKKEQIRLGYYISQKLKYKIKND